MEKNFSEINGKIGMINDKLGVNKVFEADMLLKCAANAKKLDFFENDISRLSDNIKDFAG